MRSYLGYLAALVLLFSFPLNAQIDPIPNLTVQPIPIPGGDLIPSFGIINAFIPGPDGQTPPFDPINGEPHVITNFRGVTAMGYTLGSATDNHGNPYGVITDIRVYQGDYVGGEVASADSGGATKSTLSHGTFVEI